MPAPHGLIALHGPIALHGATLPGTSALTDVEVAVAAGFDGIELWWPKVREFLRAGGSPGGLRPGDLTVTMLNVLMPVETRDPAERGRLLRRCEEMAAFAAAVGCRNIQAVALDGFAATEWPGQRRELVAALSEFAEVASARGVRLAVEPVSFSPFRTLDQALDVIAAVGRERLGLVLDTWHLWTAGVDWAQVADLDPGLIAAVQVSDATPRSGPRWSDADRAVLPGDGLIPLRPAVEAVAGTGYGGPWSCEALGFTTGDWRPLDLAVELRRRLRELLQEERCTT